MKPVRRLKFLMLMGILMISAAAMAAPANSSTAASAVKTEPTKSDYSFNLGYSVSSNMLRSEAASASHKLTFQAAYLGLDPWTFGLGTLFAYKSVGQDIPTSKDNPAFDDLSASVDRSFKLSANNTLVFAFEWSFPTSPEAQYEQYNGIGVISNSLSTQLGKYFSIGNSLSLGYIAQTNEFSPTSNERNVTSFAIYNLRLAVSPLQNFKFGAILGTKVSNYTDNTSSLERSNVGTWSLFASYKYKNLGLGLRYINGNYEDEGPARYLAFDQYKQVLGASISYEF